MANGIIPDFTKLKASHVFFAFAFSLGSWVPGLLFLFVFHRQLFLSIDLARLLLLSSCIFSPAFAIDLLLSSAVFNPTHAVRESLTAVAAMMFLICFIPALCLSYFFSLSGHKFFLIFGFFQGLICLLAVLQCSRKNKLR